MVSCLCLPRPSVCSNEGKPATGFGPPYALLQGRLPDMAEARVRGVPRAGSAAGRPRVQPAAPECTLGGSCILNHPLLCCPSAVAQAPPQEGLIEVKMGHACFIRDTKDFFIAYGDHPEWGTAHTVGRRTAAPGTGERGRQAASAMQGAAQPSPCPLWRCLGSLIRWCCPAGTGVGPGGRVVCHRLYHLAAVEVRGRGLTRAGMLRRRWRALPGPACPPLSQLPCVHTHDTRRGLLQRDHSSRVWHSHARAEAGGYRAGSGGGRHNVQRPAGPDALRLSGRQRPAGGRALALSLVGRASAWTLCYRCN